VVGQGDEEDEECWAVERPLRRSNLKGLKGFGEVGERRRGLRVLSMVLWSKRYAL